MLMIDMREDTGPGGRQIIKPVVCFIVLFSFLHSANPQGGQEEKPVTLEIIRDRLLRHNIGHDWRIEEYEFGALLFGAVHIDENDEAVKPWSEAAIIICGNEIPDILEKLVAANFSAPFKIVEQTRHYLVLTWAAADRENIRKVMDLAAELDR
jgi:hypothetical protein